MEGSFSTGLTSSQWKLLMHRSVSTLCLFQSQKLMREEKSYFLSKFSICNTITLKQHNFEVKTWSKEAHPCTKISPHLNQSPSCGKSTLSLEKISCLQQNVTRVLFPLYWLHHRQKNPRKKVGCDYTDLKTFRTYLRTFLLAIKSTLRLKTFKGLFELSNFHNTPAELQSIFGLLHQEKKYTS